MKKVHLLEIIIDFLKISPFVAYKTRYSMNKNIHQVKVTLSLSLNIDFP